MESNINVSESCLRSLANVLISWEGKKKTTNKVFYECLAEVRNENSKLFF